MIKINIDSIKRLESFVFSSSPIFVFLHIEKIIGYHNNDLPDHLRSQYLQNYNRNTYLKKETLALQPNEDWKSSSYLVILSKTLLIRGSDILGNNL